MATEIRVPTLGESVTEATVGKWFKKVGDAVDADEPLVELETDKVTVEVPAPAAGTLAEIAAKEGDTVGLGALLGTIGEAGAGKPAQKPAGGRAGRRQGRRRDRPGGGRQDRRGRRRAADRAERRRAPARSAANAAGAVGGQADDRKQPVGRSGRRHAASAARC